jgi:hypothetical protein
MALRCVRNEMSGQLKGDKRAEINFSINRVRAVLE